MLKRKGSVDPSKAKAAKDEDGYVARRSTHVTGEKFSKADGDTWQETLAGTFTFVRLVPLFLREMYKYTDAFIILL
jgi:hypothetical protein